MELTTALEPKTEEKITADFRYMESRMNGLTNSRFHEMKKQASESFRQIGIPTSKHEEWKYSPVYKHIPKNGCFATIPAEGIDHDYHTGSSSELIMVNGKFDLDSSSFDAQGIHAMPLVKALESKQKGLENYFNAIAPAKQAFNDLNTAFFEHGLYLRVSADANPKTLVHIHQIASGSETKFLHQRIFIYVEANANASFHYTWEIDGNEMPFINALEEIVIDQGGKLHQYSSQDFLPEFRILNGRYVSQQSDSFYKHLSLSTGGKFVRNNIETRYEGRGCDCDISGLYIADNNQLIDNHLSIDHAKPNCTSNQLFKGIMNGTGHGVFNGKVFVREDAQQTNAYQSNKNLLLSDKAVIDTKPQLEIFADDVKCSHGATIGQLDKEPLFYLMSRGIPKEQAKGILTLAFANELLEKIEDEELKEIWTQKLEDKLNAAIN